MIKKTTLVIFEGEKEFELKGGMPLAKGEIIDFKEEGKIIAYEVVDKRVEYSIDGEDHIVKVTYTLKKTI